MSRVGIVSDYIKKTVRGANYSETVCKPGGGADVSALNYSTPGDDSPPMSGDSALLVKIPNGDSEATVGFMDPKNQQLAARGEKRIYARDESGEIIATSWLKNDGTIISFNDNGSSEIQSDGTIEHTNASGAKSTINTDGSIVDETDLLTTTKSPDGTFVAENTIGYFKLFASGIFEANGVQILPDGTIVTPTGIIAPSVLAAGKELSGHTHNENDDAPNPTGLNN